MASRQLFGYSASLAGQRERVMFALRMKELETKFRVSELLSL